MPYDSTWQGLVNPGKNSRWFQSSASRGPIYPRDTYDPQLAQLLCEVARFTYFEHAAYPKIFKQALQSGHLTLLQSLQTDALKCQLFKCDNAAASPFCILAFRGTTDLQNWITNIQVNTTPWHTTANVHQGFYDAFRSLWVLLEPHLAKLAQPCYFTGHSLGAALATLTAAHHPPSALYHFGSPRVGDAAFAQLLESKTPTFRIVHHCDIVTTLPWKNPLSPFTHAGECHYFDHRGNHQINPTHMDIFWDTLKRDFKWQDAFKIQQIGAPAKALSDHNVINYGYALAGASFSKKFP